MSGRPVWLASVSRRADVTLRGGLIPPRPTTRWSPREHREAREILWRVLEGVGDPARWRLFRMQVTVCLHRAVSDAELAALPRSWAGPGGTALAGGPVQVLES